MKIGLMGFEFESANKGCEALVYSFLSIIKNQLNNVDVIYNFSDTSLGKVQEYFKGINVINVLPKLKDVTFFYIRMLKKCDIVFDVTMGDSFSDIYSKSYYKTLVRGKKIAELLCSRYVLLPQTYGPFYNKDSEKKAYSIIKKAFKVYCRDDISQKLLEEKFNIHNSILVSDMAFVLPYDKTMYSFSDKKKIGINISGLLYRGGFNDKNQFGLTLDYPELIKRIISTLLKMYEVHLIPHVIDLNENAYDDDYKTCAILNKEFPNTILAPAFDTPIQAKSYISNMDMFIGSRMHSTIAAFSSGVVTIPISYSRKFEGLFGNLNYQYVINARKETTDSAYDLVIKLINDRNRLVESQEKALILVEKKNKAFSTSLLSFLSGE